MGLDVPALEAGDVLEPAPERVERVTQRDVGVLVMIAIDHDIVAGNPDDDADVEPMALLMVATLLLDGHVAPGHVRMELVELGGLLPDTLLERLRPREIAHRDLQRSLHVDSRWWVDRPCQRRPGPCVPLAHASEITIRAAGRMPLDARQVRLRSPYRIATRRHCGERIIELRDHERFGSSVARRDVERDDPPGTRLPGDGAGLPRRQVVLARCVREVLFQNTASMNRRSASRTSATIRAQLSA